jgi:hypothetical protein
VGDRRREEKERGRGGSGKHEGGERSRHMETWNETEREYRKSQLKSAIGLF